MKLKKGFLSLLIATVLTSSALIVPSINVYASTIPNVSAIMSKVSANTPKVSAIISKASSTTTMLKASASTSSSNDTIQSITLQAGVYDSVHNVCDFIGYATFTGSSGTYTKAIFVATDINGNPLAANLAPNMDQFQSIATDGNGDVVIGSCYNFYTSVPGANAQPIPEYMATYNYIYTTSDGGQTLTQTASGDRMVDFNTGMYYSGYDGTIYLGRTQSITYSENQFVATGEYGANFYSSNGYNWHQ